MLKKVDTKAVQIVPPPKITPYKHFKQFINICHSELDSESESMSLRASETNIAIAMPANNNEMLKQVQHDKVLCHYKASTTHDPCTYDQSLMCCPASGSAITTSNAAHSPRDDKNITPRPLGRGIKGEGANMSLRGSETTVAIAMPANNNEMLKQVQHDKLVSEAHVNELNVLSF